ncbi:MAG: molecular chaperone [Chlorobiaceae bacterium]|nr:molecular chaperone [Chlorobiaceae bacterium]
MKNTVWTGLFLLFGTLFAQSLYADHIYNLFVSPKMFELNLDTQPISESIRLKNNSGNPLSLRATVQNWTIDEENKLKTVPSDTESLDQWIVVTPENITVKPGKEAVVQFSVTPHPSAEPGEHRAIIYITERYPTAIGEGIELTFSQGIGIYGYSGTILRAAILKEMTFERGSGTLSVDIENIGNVHSRFHGDYSIWKKERFAGVKALKGYLNKPDKKNKPQGFIASGSVNTTPVLAGNRRTIKTILPVTGLPAGYIVVVSGSINNQKVEKIFR